MKIEAELTELHVTLSCSLAVFSLAGSRRDSLPSTGRLPLDAGARITGIFTSANQKVVTLGNPNYWTVTPHRVDINKVSPTLLE